jgi:hypothetical protein
MDECTLRSSEAVLSLLECNFLLHFKSRYDESYAAVRFLGVILEESDARSAGKVAHVRP